MKQTYPRVRVKTRKPVAARPNIRASYEAARNDRRADLWKHASGVGPETSGRMYFEKLRNRSRYEAKNHPVASRIVDVLVAETIGSGLRPHIVGDENLEKKWDQWAQECDADGVQDFYGLEALIFRDQIIGGDAFGRGRPRRLSDGLTVPMQIQLLPGEFCPYDTTFLQNSKSGILFSGPGQRSAYAFHKIHPGEVGAGFNANDFSIVPASSVAHVFSQREIGQIRGEPWLTRAIIKIAELDQFTDAELIRKKMTAMIAFFVEMPQDENAIILQEEDENGNLIDVDAMGNPIDDPFDLLPEVEPGATLPLPAGAKITQTQTADVGGTFDPFIRQVMREICAAVSVPYELITNDWSGVNDRLARVSLLKFYQQVKQWRQMMVRQFCRPMWRQFLNAAYESGAWTPPEGKTVADFMNVEWIGDPFPHIHPVQDVQADAAAVKAGFKTRSQVIRERGGSPETVREERAAELAADDAAGIVNDTDPRIELQQQEGQKNGTQDDDQEEDNQA